MRKRATFGRKSRGWKSTTDPWRVQAGRECVGQQEAMVISYIKPTICVLLLWGFFLCANKKKNQK